MRMRAALAHMAVGETSRSGKGRVRLHLIELLVVITLLADRADVVAPDCEKLFMGPGSTEAFIESIPESFWEGLHPRF
jgi:hypothetical protein